MNKTTYFDFDITYGIKGEEVIHMTIRTAASLLLAVQRIAAEHDTKPENIEVYRAISWGYKGAFLP